MLASTVQFSSNPPTNPHPTPQRARGEQKAVTVETTTPHAPARKPAAGACSLRTQQHAKLQMFHP